MGRVDGDELMAVVSLELEREVERFLYREAQLLDDRCFSEWLALFAPTCTYELRFLELATSRRGRRGRPPDPVEHVLTSEDREALTLRVARLEQSLTYAELPPSVTRRIVSNILVEGIEGSEVIINSNILVYQSRTERHHLLVGRRVDRLVLEDDGYRIHQRAVTLDHTTLPRTVTQLL
jgi:3-phenylpropionate/cinnamic acid dioxygenase small subunit